MNWLKSSCLLSVNKGPIHSLRNHWASTNSQTASTFHNLSVVEAAYKAQTETPALTNCIGTAVLLENQEEQHFVKTSVLTFISAFIPSCSLSLCWPHIGVTWVAWPVILTYAYNIIHIWWPIKTCLMLTLSFSSTRHRPFKNDSYSVLLEVPPPTSDVCGSLL